MSRLSANDRRRGRRRMRPNLMALEDRALLSTFTVTGTADDGSFGTLRWAIGQANSTAGADTIVFDSSFNSAKTITLGGSALTLTDPATTTISGPGAGRLSVSGNNTSRVFAINPGASAALSGLTIKGGLASGTGSASRGGGLVNRGTTSLTDCTVSGNRATISVGGGLYNAAGSLSLTNCTVSGNTGGGILSAGTMTVNNSTVSGNSGTGISNDAGTLSATGCTIDGNINAGVFTQSGGLTTLSNCTVTRTGGSYSSGFGVQNNGTTALISCTVTGNRTGLLENFGRMSLCNTISGGNRFSDEFTTDSGSGQVTSLGHNLIGDGGTNNPSTTWVGSDLTGTGSQPLDPLLAPLGDYGGPTRTVARPTDIEAAVRPSWAGCSGSA
jgi:hypothetical protein